MPLNFTVTWDQHDYTYRIDPEDGFWEYQSIFKGYDFTIHCNIGGSNTSSFEWMILP